MRTLRTPSRYPLRADAAPGVRFRGAVAGLAAALSLTLAGSTPAAALTAAAGVLGIADAAAPSTHAAAADARWLPWLGCWTPAALATDAESPDRVCILPEPDGVGVEIVTVEADEVVGTVRVVADGEEHPVTESGCSGWERAHWSEDGRRLFRRSEVDCEGVRRVTSSVVAMLPNAIWLDVQVASVNGQRYATRALRYRPADAPSALETRVSVALAGLEAAQAADRIDAARRPSTDAVIETVEVAGAEVAETLIAERGEGFELDAATLTELADAGVPGEVTDLMIALSYPDEFDVNRADRVAAPFDGRVRALDRTPLASPIVGFDPYYGIGRGGYYASCYGSPFGRGYGFGAFGYGLGPGCGAYGRSYYGPGYGWTYGGTGVVVVRESPPATTADDRRARVVNGRGYTRGGGGSSRGISRSWLPDRNYGSSIGSSSSSGSRGVRSGSGSSVRKAKPRGSSGSGSDRTAKPRKGSSGSGS